VLFLKHRSVSPWPLVCIYGLASVRYATPRDVHRGTCGCLPSTGSTPPRTREPDGRCFRVRQSSSDRDRADIRRLRTGAASVAVARSHEETPLLHADAFVASSTAAAAMIGKSPEIMGEPVGSLKGTKPVVVFSDYRWLFVDARSHRV
jgi:hypothetical protein